MLIACLMLQGSEHAEQYDAKHESSLVYEGGTLSYDPGVYGGNFQDRYHIKTLKASYLNTPASPLLSPLSTLSPCDTGVAKYRIIWVGGFSDC